MTTFDDLRTSFADNPQKLAELDAWQEREEYVKAHEPTVIPPCPSWCRFVEVIPPFLGSDRLH
ncbi:MAG: hypothetical protein M3N95_00215, partial [Actinomycetota bacterium]|nr:hypothetical protein [Actinomycetota bacterium]